MQQSNRVLRMRQTAGIREELARAFRAFRPSDPERHGSANRRLELGIPDRPRSQNAQHAEQRLESINVFRAPRRARSGSRRLLGRTNLYRTNQVLGSRLPREWRRVLVATGADPKGQTRGNGRQERMVASLGAKERWAVSVRSDQGASLAFLRRPSGADEVWWGSRSTGSTPPGSAPVAKCPGPSGAGNAVQDWLV